MYSSWPAKLLLFLTPSFSLPPSLFWRAANGQELHLLFWCCQNMLAPALGCMSTMLPQPLPQADECYHLTWAVPSINTVFLPLSTPHCLVFSTSHALPWPKGPGSVINAVSTEYKNKNYRKNILKFIKILHKVKNSSTICAPNCGVISIDSRTQQTGKQTNEPSINHYGDNWTIGQIDWQPEQFVRPWETMEGIWQANAEGSTTMDANQIFADHVPLEELTPSWLNKLLQVVTSCCKQLPAKPIWVNWGRWEMSTGG